MRLKVPAIDKGNNHENVILVLVHFTASFSLVCFLIHTFKCHCFEIFFRVGVQVVFLPSALCIVWYHGTKNVNNVCVTI